MFDCIQFLDKGDDLKLGCPDQHHVLNFALQAVREVVDNQISVYTAPQFLTCELRKH